jgi:predicted RNA binding protein YcfA (HicA-like mRNA interferase family)
MIHTSDQLIALLQKHGWAVVRQKGSHVTLKHPDRAVLVTVPHPRKDIAKGLSHAILRKAGLR